MLDDVFGLVEHQETATFGLGFILRIKRQNDDADLIKAEAIAVARFKKNHIHWYVPHYTPSISQQDFLSKEYSCKTPTELRYTERSVL